jgi:hypothetical protein
MRKAIRRALLGLQLGPPKQNFVTCETDGNGRFAMQKSEAVSVSDGSWLCRNAREREEFAFLAAFAIGVLHFLRSDYALIAAMRGWMPMMFITRVRL